MKFGRTYQLSVGFINPGATVQVNSPLSIAGAQALSVPASSEIVEINYPLTIEFDIVRAVFSSCPRATITVYNLGEDNRQRLFHDRYDTLYYQPIILQAGYTSEGSTPLATIFKGNVQAAYSYSRKENWVTVFECFSGGFGVINGQASVNQGAPWNLNQVISTLIGQMPNVVAGVINLPVTPNARGISVKGNAWDAIQRLAGNNNAFIDNETVNVVAQDYYIPSTGNIPLISADTGLLGSPRKLGNMVEVDFVFEPRIIVKQLIELQSTQKIYNGQYCVYGIKHRGTISGAVCGNAITTFSLWNGQGILQEAQGIAA